MLASPRFLFRAEIQPQPDNPGKVVPVDEFALASRLSYFLWSSMPDDELFRLAREKKELRLGNVLLLGSCGFMLLLAGIMGLDLVRNMWGWNENLALNSSLMEAILSLLP